MDFFINYNPNQSETIYFPEFFFTLTSYIYPLNKDHLSLMQVDF